MIPHDAKLAKSKGSLSKAKHREGSMLVTCSCLPVCNKHSKIWWFPQIAVPQSSSILMAFSIINRPFWDPPFKESPIFTGPRAVPALPEATGGKFHRPGSPPTAEVGTLMFDLEKNVYGGFHKWGYPHSWFVYHGTSH